MGTRAWTMHWWTISYDNLVSLCDEAVRRVESHADFMPDETWYRIASDDCESRGLMAEVRRLQHAFASATNGLELEFLAYDEDMDITRGRLVDPWEGCIFGVRGVTDFTPAGKALEPLLVESGWVDGG
jgi:hypothetical protein